MPKRTIEIPEELSEFGDAIQKVLNEMRDFKAIAAKDGAPVKFTSFEDAVDARFDEAKLVVKRRALQDLELDAERMGVAPILITRRG